MNKQSLDMATVIGYTGALISIYLGLVLAHGSLHHIAEPAAFFVSFGGAFFATMIQISLKEMMNVPKILKNIYFVKNEDPKALIQQMTSYAEIARRSGILALEGVLKDIQDPFMGKALRLAADGTSPDVMKQMLSIELDSMKERHGDGKRIFDSLATYAPAFGMLGTIMHLVLVLSNLSDPSSIGPMMANALLSTFYGVLGCYFVFTPVAKKLERRGKEEILQKQIIMQGTMSIQSGDSPRLLNEKLKMYLSARESAIE